MKTLIVGLGNPMLGDDGVGWKVAEKICQQLPADGPVVVDRLSLGGTCLMEHLIGYNRAILIDAFTSDDEIGSIHIMKLKDIPNYSAFHISSKHDISLWNAIEMGKSLGAFLPEDIVVIRIATQPIHKFTEKLSPCVLAAVPQAVNIALELLKQDFMMYGVKR